MANKKKITQKVDKKISDIKKNTKQKVEHIKEDAQEYYKGKNMISRYIIIGFLFILLVLQFLLPNNKSTKDVETADLYYTGIQIEQSNIVVPDDASLLLLDHGIDIINMPVFESTIAEITSNEAALYILYKKALSFLPYVELKLNTEDLGIDFKYLSLLNGLSNPIRDLSPELAEEYGLRIDDDIDETLNIHKSTAAVIAYLRDIYNEVDDWDLTVIGYFIGIEELEDIMNQQDQSEFNNLYFEPALMQNYYKVLAYKYVIENISNYLGMADMYEYPQAETETIKLGETKDLLKRADKEGYTFKEIKTLNPWILGDKLPKGNWELQVYLD